MDNPVVTVTITGPLFGPGGLQPLVDLLAKRWIEERSDFVLPHTTVVEDTIEYIGDDPLPEIKDQMDEERA